jgi:predicted SAM-dependent methyltransferase
MLKNVMIHALKQVGNSAINRERLKRQLSTFDRVNAGCGDLFTENWLNIGLFSNRFIPYGTVKQVGAAYVMHFDLTEDLPLEANAVQYLYASHFIEHLAFDQAQEFLRRCHRVMRQGGILRLTTPDLELWVRKYSENDLEFFERFYQIEQSYPDLATKGQILVGQIRGWTHRWFYDYLSLEDILIRAGFSHVAKREALESSIPDIEKLEPCSEFRLMETLYVEARK